jgi:chromatin remodeling complex protein RSC6
MADTTITLQDVFDEIKLLRKDLRKVKSLIEDPQGEKAKARSTSNGFNKPLDISEELRKFLKMDVGEQISRSQVTKKMNEYVTEKGLKQGQLINMDASLKAILDPPADVQVTFLNIQKYINKHYIKAEKPVKEKAPAAAAAPETPKPTAAAKRPTVKKA